MIARYRVCYQDIVHGERVTFPDRTFWTYQIAYLSAWWFTSARPLSAANIYEKVTHAPIQTSQGWTAYRTSR